MIKFKLKPVTDTSWILLQNGTRLAMIIADGTGYKAIGTLPIKYFSSLEDMSKKLGHPVEFEEVEKPIELELSEVAGFPIKHNSAFDILNDNFPSYAKTSKSSNRFAAGYYGILFNYGWVSSYCPKVSTLNEYEWIGPFKTRLEMLNAISTKKKEPKI